MLLKVENEKALVRDSNNNAVLNTDKESLTRNRVVRRNRKQNEELITKLENDVASMKQQFDQLKESLANIGIKI